MGLKDLFSTKKAQPQRPEAELRKHRCAFTGHRPNRLYGCEGDVIVSLRKEILAAIEDGYTTFITGCSTGVDLWAADIVIEMRRQNKELKLICAVPFEGFDSKWPVDWVKHYKMVRKQADWVEIISPSYSPEAYQKEICGCAVVPVELSLYGTVFPAVPKIPSTMQKKSVWQ